MTDWFRSWHGAPTDPKWLVVARKADTSPAIVTAIVWALFDYASQHVERGTVDGFDVETYAVWSGLSEPEVLAVLVALEEKGVIQDGRLTNWEKRQPKREDVSTERVRAHRRRLRDTQDETHCNADETQGNAPEKRRGETEQSESRAEGEESGARAPDTPHDLFEVYLGVLGKTGEKLAPAWVRASHAHCRDVLEQGFDAERFGRFLAYRRAQGRSLELRWLKQDIGQWEAEGEPDMPTLPAVRGSPNGTPRPLRTPNMTGLDQVYDAMKRREEYG